MPFYWFQHLFLFDFGKTTSHPFRPIASQISFSVNDDAVLKSLSWSNPCFVFHRTLVLASRVGQKHWWWSNPSHNNFTWSLCGSGERWKIVGKTSTTVSSSTIKVSLLCSQDCSDEAVLFRERTKTLFENQIDYVSSAQIASYCVVLL